MYSVFYTDKANHALLSYVRYYEEVQSKRFEDSGLWCEDVIIGSYQKKAQELFLTFHDHIVKRLSGETVFGYRSNLECSGEATLITPIGKYTLMIEYLEEHTKQCRTVLSLKIFRE